MTIWTIKVVLLLSVVSLPNLATQTKKGTPKGTQKTGTGALTRSPAPQKTPTPPQEDKAPSVGVIRAKISTSRPEVSINGSYGIFADLENIGTVPVTIYSDETVLTVQPEVIQQSECVYKVNGFFPTESYPLTATENHKPSKAPSPTPIASTTPPQSNPTPTANSNQPAPDARGVPIRIQPSEHYTVFWDVNRSPISGSTCNAPTHWYDAYLDPLSFVPGEYVFTIDGKAYLDDETKYHTYTEKTTLRVSITELLAIAAAAFGGFLAYCVTALQPDKDIDKLKRAQDADKRSARLAIVRGIFAAPLMGAAVTIVFSRLADTQFPIKVSVNDVWGAMTIGFISFFVGNKLIEKLVGTVKS
jgi:hypothetical protein